MKNARFQGAILFFAQNFFIPEGSQPVAGG